MIAQGGPKLLLNTGWVSGPFWLVVKPRFARVAGRGESGAAVCDFIWDLLVLMENYRDLAMFTISVGDFTCSCTGLYQGKYVDLNI